MMNKKEYSMEFRSVNNPPSEISMTITENAELSTFFENAVMSIAVTISTKNM
jgi:hypothetical protein